MTNLRKYFSFAFSQCNDTIFLESEQDVQLVKHSVHSSKATGVQVKLPKSNPDRLTFWKGRTGPKKNGSKSFVFSADFPGSQPKVTLRTESRSTGVLETF